MSYANMHVLKGRNYIFSSVANEDMGASVSIDACESIEMLRFPNGK